jgi:hypothetical protein
MWLVSIASPGDVLYFDWFDTKEEAESFADVLAAMGHEVLSIVFVPSA